MRFYSNLSLFTKNPAPSPLSHHDSEEKPTLVHGETLPSKSVDWKTSRAGDGDTAMALFDTPDEVGEVVEPKELRRLERKIDAMILPYLAVSVITSGR